MNVSEAIHVSEPSSYHHGEWCFCIRNKTDTGDQLREGWWGGGWRGEGGVVKGRGRKRGRIHEWG